MAILDQFGRETRPAKTPCGFAPAKPTQTIKPDESFTVDAIASATIYVEEDD